MDDVHKNSLTSLRLNLTGGNNNNRERALANSVNADSRLEQVRQIQTTRRSKKKKKKSAVYFPLSRVNKAHCGCVRELPVIVTVGGVLTVGG